LFDCIWLFSPKQLVITAHKNGLRTPLESIPDWWFHGIQGIYIMGSACDIDVDRALLSKAPHCDSIHLEPCFIIDSVTTLLGCMRQIHELKYIRLLHKESIDSASNTIIADDSTIDALIPLSIACPEGLHWFGVDSIPSDFSLAKVFELLEKGHLSPECELFFKTVRGTEATLMNWITTHAQQMPYQHIQYRNHYEFAYRKGDIRISIGEFLP
uniref:SAM-dependent methyltransferase n=1 Tax=Heligmosomoides polygyrus TaxID=6339 RepID=A0A183FS24_HELPZ